MSYPYRVMVIDNTRVTKTHDLIEWLFKRNQRPEVDYDFDMNGGILGYSDFWFKDRMTAIIVKLIWADAKIDQ